MGKSIPNASHDSVSSSVLFSALFCCTNGASAQSAKATCGHLGELAGNLRHLHALASSYKHHWIHHFHWPIHALWIHLPHPPRWTIWLHSKCTWKCFHGCPCIIRRVQTIPRGVLFAGLSWLTLAHSGSKNVLLLFSVCNLAHQSSLWPLQQKFPAHLCSPKCASTDCWSPPDVINGWGQGTFQT